MRKLILLIIAMTLCNLSYSQNTSEITIQQVKTANLIFAEHQKLSLQVPLLETKISNLELVNKSWEKTDSVRKIQLLQYHNTIENKNEAIEKLNKSLKLNKKIITYGTCALTISICLLLLK